MKSQMIKRISAFVCLFLFSGMFFAYSKESNEFSNLFSHEDVRIEANQVIQRLLVAEGNATVFGNIREGIVIVDGNLLIAPEARIKGSIIVLGGYVEQQQGSLVLGRVLTIRPQRFPMLNLVIGSLALLTLLSLILLPAVVGLVFYACEKFPFYMQLKKYFFTIQRDQPILYIILTLGFSCCMLVLFTELAWQTIFRHTMDMFDNTVIWLVRYFANSKLDRIMIFISSLGYGYFYGFIVVMVFSLLAIYRRWLEFAGLGLCLSGGAVLNFLLKNLFERARPDAFRLVAASGYSFPSGHAMVSIYFYGMLAYLLARNIRSWRGRYIVMILTMLFILAMGISRIYLGVHYPSDIIAGYTAGSMWLMFSISLLLWWERKRRV